MLKKAFKKAENSIVLVVKYIFISKDQRAVISNFSGFLLALALLTTQILDALSTKLGLRVLAKEQNGAMEKVIELYGFRGFFALKLFVGIFLGWLAWKKVTTSLILISVYLFVILNNLIVLSKHMN